MSADAPLAISRLPLILMYHAVGEYQEDPFSLCVTPERFATHMRVLQRLGLRGVGVGELLNAWRNGGWHGLVGITFDDGYRGLVEAALPELRARRFSATVFVLSELMGRSNEWDASATKWPLLSVPDIERLIDAGIEIGSHGSRHVALSTADAEQRRAEVISSRERLESKLGIAVRGFAYPYGSCNDRARLEVRGAGYEYACAVEPLSSPGVFALPRIGAVQRDTPTRLAAKTVAYRRYLAHVQSREARQRGGAGSRMARGVR
jgi:peptidoglycan/xylan/chitin deacetylase (PgdA/CDA1 family)